MESIVPKIEEKLPSDSKQGSKYPPKVKRRGRDILEAFPNQYHKLENGQIIKLGGK